MLEQKVRERTFDLQQRTKDLKINQQHSLIFVHMKPAGLKKHGTGIYGNVVLSLVVAHSKLL